MGIDAAFPFSPQKGAASYRMRRAVIEQFRIMTAYGIRLHLEDGQIIDTAIATTATAMKTRSVELAQRVRLAVNPLMQRLYLNERIHLI
jgi:hypothetical protein